MENKIFICETECYLKASQEQKEKVKPEWNFDLEKLLTEGMRREFRQFLVERAKTVTVITMVNDRNCYNRICRFLKDKDIRVESFQDKTLEEWMRKLNAWLMQQGMARTKRNISVYGKEKFGLSEIIKYFRRIYFFTEAKDTRKETEKDIWNLKKIDVPYKVNPIKNFETLNFKEIIQPAIKEETKRAVFRHLFHTPLPST